MSSLSIFDFDGQVVRSGGTADAPWFVASDVCTILGLDDTSRAVASLEDDEKGTSIVRTLRGDQELLTVTEPGLYVLTCKSRKPEAKAFKRWVFHDLLPAIRKTGSYSVPTITPDHIAAHSFNQDKFLPFKSESPIAAQFFLEWQGLAIAPSQVMDRPPEFALPSPQLQEALNGAFLNLNRSGLAMNKLFHFLDRIPTMKDMSGTAIDELAEALEEAGQKIAELQDRNVKLAAENSNLKAQAKAKPPVAKRDNDMLRDRILKLNIEIQGLKTENFALNKKLSDLNAPNVQLLPPSEPDRKMRRINPA